MYQASYDLSRLPPQRADHPDSRRTPRTITRRQTQDSRQRGGTEGALRSVRDFARKEWPLQGSPADVRRHANLRLARMADDFTERYGDLLAGSYDCVDRVVLNAFFPIGHNPGGFRSWWRRLHGSDDQLDDTHLMRMAGRFARRVKAWAAANGVPVIFCTAGERKHLIAEQYLEENSVSPGVFLILAAKAPASVWKVHHSARGVITRLGTKRQQRLPLQLPHHGPGVRAPGDQDVRAPAVRRPGDPRADGGPVRPDPGPDPVPAGHPGDPDPVRAQDAAAPHPQGRAAGAGDRDPETTVRAELVPDQLRALAAEGLYQGRARAALRGHRAQRQRAALPPQPGQLSPRSSTG